MEENSLVTLASFTAPHEAHLARSLLESEGIPAFIFDEYFVGIKPWMSDVVGGVKVKIMSSNLEQGRRVLNTDSQFNKSLVREADWGICPECGSDQLQYFRGSNQWGKMLSGLLTILFLGLPWMFRSHQLRCQACRHIWKIGD